MTSLDRAIDRYISYLLIEKGLANRTLSAYSADLQRYQSFLREHRLDQIDQTDKSVILKYLIALRRQGLGARSRARHLVTIRGFYRFLVKEKLIAEDPVRTIDLPKAGLKLPDTLSVAEIQQLINMPDFDRPTEVRNGAMLELLYAAGSVYTTVLAGIKRMRLGRNLHLGKWIFISVFPFHGSLGSDRGAGQKSKAAGQILENYITVNWVSCFSHFNFLGFKI